MHSGKMLVVLLFGIACHVSAGQGKRDNVGIYGGKVMSYAFDAVHGKLFATVEGALSCFTSSDSGYSWKQSFPDDSLSFMNAQPDSCIPPDSCFPPMGTDPGTWTPPQGCKIPWQPPQGCQLAEERGWAGSSYQIHSRNGVTLVIAGAGTNSAVVSTDGEHWRTLLDSYIMRSKIQPQFRCNVGGVNCGAVTSNAIFTCVNNNIFITRDTGKTWKVVSFPDSNALDAQEPDRKTVLWISPIPGDTTATKFYVITSPSKDWNTRKLYRCTDGKTFTEIPVKDGDSTVHLLGKLYIDEKAADTMFLQIAGLPGGFFRTYDAGVTWVKKSSSGSPGVPARANIQFFQDTTLPGTHHIRICAGNDYSDDLCETWKTVFTPGLLNAPEFIAYHIPNSNIYYGFRGDGPLVCKDSIGGKYALKTPGMAAVAIKQIGQDPKHLNRVYMATASGIAFTSAYTDTTVKGENKWKAPYGVYPLFTDAQSVMVSPYDSLTVYAGTGNEILVTKTGGTTENSWTKVGFNQITGYNGTDINGGRFFARFAMYSKDTIFVALHGTEEQEGWLVESFDAGATWHVNTRLGKRYLSTVVVASNPTSGKRVIYAGSGAKKGCLWRSQDGGATWDSTPGPMNAGGGNNNGTAGNEAVRTISVPAGQTDTVYVGGVFKIGYSTNGGATIDTISTNYPGGGFGITSSTISKTSKDSVFFSYGRTILVLDAKAKKIKEFYKCLPGEIIWDVYYDDLIMASSQGAFDIKSGQNNVGPTGITNKKVKQQGINKLSVITSYQGITLLSCVLPFSGNVKISIIDLAGRQVSRSVMQNVPAGLQRFVLDTHRLSKGVYFIQIRQNGMTQTVRMSKLY